VPPVDRAERQVDLYYELMMERFKIYTPIILASALIAAAPRDFVRVNAVYVPPEGVSREGAVEARFTALEPQIVVNETPPARLRLEPRQTVLLDKQGPPPPRKGPIDPMQMKYLDLSRPIRFPVALAPDVTRGEHSIKAAIIYYYCSKRDGWCRKGRSDVSLRVEVP
jgi:hypothetical protein